MKKNEQTGLYESKYWHPAVTTDAVFFGFDGKDLNVLLIERGNDPFKGMWALPGGFFVESDKDALSCLRRELKEETSLKLKFTQEHNGEVHWEDVPVKEVGIFSKNGRDPRERVITIAFTALIRKDDYEIQAGTDAKNVSWFKINELPELAFDHRDIIQAALVDLKKTILFEPVGFELLSEEFSMQQLQNIYIAILDPERKNPKLGDRRNFRKKMESLKYIELIEGKSLTAPGRRPSNCYRFNEAAYKAAKDKGIHLEFYN